MRSKARGRVGRCIAVTTLRNAKPKIPMASCLQHNMENVFMERGAYPFSEVAAVV